jgi:hypothetical protein
MGRRSFPGGIISSTEPSVTGYGASGIWTTQTAAQKKNSGFWPIPGITPSGPLVGPTIGNVAVTDSNYNTLNDTPFISSTGGYIKITGTGFASGAVVYVGGSAAVTTSFINSTEVRAQVAAGTTSNAFPVYVVNTDSSVAIKLAAVTYSGLPSWSTSSTLAAQATDTSFSIALSATSDSSITYSLAAGSSLPPGTALSSGGVFSGTVTSASITVDTTYSFDVVANDAENQDASRTFTVTVTVGDPFFYLTPLLLNGEATTWITDASANKLLPTVSGDSKPSAFSPYNSSWGAYFDGTGDYLSIPANADWAFGTGDFTLEAWVYLTANQVASATILGNNSNPNGWYLAFNTSPGNNYVIVSNYTTVFITSSSAVPTGAWTHIATVRSGTALTLYFNGVSVGSATNSSTLGDASAAALIGWNGASSYFTGYISNARVVKGVAVYTGAFTPPTAVFGNTQSSGTNISAITAGSALLTLQDNRLRDNGKNALTITRAGDAAIKAMGPFAETDTATGSAYFDGNGDYLTYPTNTALNFSTGDFTIEFWAYLTANPSNDWMFISAVTSASNGLFFGVANFTSPYGIGFGRAGTAWDYLTTVSPALNSWTHYVLTRTGTSVRIFVNGTQLGTTQTLSTSYDLGLGGMTVGAEIPGTLYMTGYMSDLRIVKGVGVYTGNFTPPTSLLATTQSSSTNVAAISSSASTSMLALQYRVGENNHRFVDESGAKNLMQRAGNATQGTFSPFSPAGWSGYFNGSSDYLTVAGNNIMNFGSSNWTVECWVYLNALPTSDSWPAGFSSTMVIITVGTASTADGVGCIIGQTKLVIQNNDSALVSSSNHGMVINRWYHLAYVRVSNTINFYVNGTALGAGVSYVGSVGTGGTTWIGTESNQGAYFNGYISNLRVVNGLAVYTGNFTVPITALTATQSAGTNIEAITVGQTTFLGLQNNRFVDANTTPKTVSIGSTTRIQAFNPFRPSAVYNPTLHGGSAYFDGTGDAVYNTTAPATNFSTADFTVEYWVYPTASTNGYIQHVGAATTSAGIAFGTASSMGLYATTSTVGFGGNLTVITNQWNHIAWTRQSGWLRGYVNGAVGYSASVTTNFTELATSIGAATNGSTYPLTGYISDVRFLKGNAQYTTSTFTVPTAPSSLTPNVSLKLSFTNGGIVDATARNSFETLGDVKIGNVQSKFGSGALQFDGTGDYLKFQALPQYTFGTGDFTFECWVYLNSYNGTWGSQIFGIHTYAVVADYLWSINTTGKLVFQITSSLVGAITSTSSVPLTTWTHIALVRASGTVTPYINGTSAGGAATYTTAMTVTNTIPTIGADSSGDSRAALNGYIDDFRISRYARYTANFTAPTSTFQTK